MDPGDVASRLLLWYGGAARDLPWRRTRDPYAIWVSEVMLQQTRVETVIPYYDAFLARFPNIAALAGAAPDEVKAAWSGLGYYRRASLMHEAARVVCDRHLGELPSEPEALGRLPGFGPYTTGAVLAIAFDRPIAAVDGNVARVLARLSGRDGTAADKHIRDAATAIMRGDRPGDLAQALIELGALVCRPRAPRCLECPIESACRAKAGGFVERIPSAKKRRPTPVIGIAALVALDHGSLWLERRPERGVFGGLFFLPTLEELPGSIDAGARARAIEIARARFGLEAKALGELVHQLTHRRLEVALFRADGRLDGPSFELVPLPELHKVGLPTLVAKALEGALTPEEHKNVRLRRRRTNALERSSSVS
ncbi:MAG: A/G-specific adenine glycosylase [Deltaproteobacteria bacterium]|nr:A/G-specific adenine glycosylase [Deltaproteobacteria bacterium]